MTLSITLPSRGVNAMGLRSPISSGVLTFGIGTIMALRHFNGNYPLCSDLLIIISKYGNRILKHIFKIYVGRLFIPDDL